MLLPTTKLAISNLKLKRVKSNLRYTESKLVKEDHGKRKKY